MYSVIIIVHVLLALGIIGLVLLQHGRGADAGAAFGSGASATVFGSRGSANFLSRTTAVLAALFFATSLTLATIAGKPAGPTSIMDSATAVEEPVVEQPKAQSDLPQVPAAQEGDVPAAK